MPKKCLMHKMKEVYYGEGIAIGCEKKNKVEQILKGKWKVLKCEVCGFEDISDLRKGK